MDWSFWAIIACVIIFIQNCFVDKHYRNLNNRIADYEAKLVDIATKSGGEDNGNS